MTTNNTSLVSLDLLRAAAAILVVAEHARSLAFGAFGTLPPDQQTLLAKVLYLATRLGQEGVFIFFVLSGFLVGGQIIRRARAGRFDVRDYAIDRSARIFLPLVPAVIFAAIVGTFFHAAPFDPVQIAGNMSGLNGILVETLPHNVPLWSLSCEIWFYTLAGVVAVAFTGRGNLFVLVAALAVTLAFSRLDASLILVWGLGALISVIEIPRGKGVLAALGLAVMIAGSFEIQMSRPSASIIGAGQFSFALARGIYSVGFAMTLPWLISEPVNVALAGWKSLARATSFVAGMSYTLYLFHYPLLAIMEAWVAPGPLSMRSGAAFVGALSACFCFAAAMYWLFERHTDAVRQWAKRDQATSTGYLKTSGL